MKLLLLAAAERIIRDSENDRMTLIDIVDSMASESFPYYIDGLSLLIIYHKEGGDGEKEVATITIKNNDDILTVQEQDVKFGERIGNRTVTVINGFVLPQPGTFSVLIEHKGVAIGDWTVPVALEN